MKMSDENGTLSQMDIAALMFFEKMPEAYPLYMAVQKMIYSEFDSVSAKVQKSQIAFSNKHNFAFVSLPRYRMKGHPDVYIFLTFGLNRRVMNSRIFQAVEPYPGRWTHHVIIQSEDELDEQIREWMTEAYLFSLKK